MKFLLSRILPVIALLAVASGTFAQTPSPTPSPSPSASPTASPSPSPSPSPTPMAVLSDATLIDTSRVRDSSTFFTCTIPAISSGDIVNGVSIAAGGTITPSLSQPFAPGGARNIHLDLNDNDSDGSLSVDVTIIGIDQFGVTRTIEIASFIENDSTLKLAPIFSKVTLITVEVSGNEAGDTFTATWGRKIGLPVDVRTTAQVLLANFDGAPIMSVVDIDTTYDSVDRGIAVVDGDIDGLYQVLIK